LRLSEKILIIEDEASLARFIELELTFEGYSVTICNDGREGYERFNKEEFDLVLLDLMLPSLNGMEICRRIRRVSNVPIIMLTAKDEIMDKVAGLDSGANDYMTKPFAIEELLARMRVAFRKVKKTNSKENDIVSFMDISIDTRKMLAKVGKTPVDLTKKEYELLLYLAKNKNTVLTREQIFNGVWGYDYLGGSNIVDVYVRYLRTKIDEKFGKKYIYTARGTGYFVKDEE
jgi:DNA-binding response OmpR family regulator